MTQQGITLVTSLRAGCEKLADLLRQEQDRLGAVEGLHFLSFFIVADRTHPPLLVMEANFDGPRREFLQRLIAANEDLLHHVYGCCADYPGRDNAKLCTYLAAADRGYGLFYVGCPGLTLAQIEEERDLAQRIGARAAQLDAPTGRRYEIVREIWDGLARQDRAAVLAVPKLPFWVRNKLSEKPAATIYGLVARKLYWLGLAVALLMTLQWLGAPLWSWLAPPPEAFAAARRWARLFFWVAVSLTVVWAVAHAWEFPAELRPRTRLYVIAAKYSGFIRASLCAIPGFLALLGLIALLYWYGWALLWALRVLLAAVLVLGAVGLVWLSLIRAREVGDRVDDMIWKPGLANVRAREDNGAQNHLASVVPIKPGWLRMLTLRVVLFGIHWLARIVYNPRGLFSTQSIHFARWTILPGRRLLFLSNYAGSFGGYLGIFATLGAAGVSAIWGNTDGFPRSYFLFGDGPRDEQHFKCYARASQVETLLWYRAYPTLSVSTIQANAQVREDLARFSRDGRDVPESDFDAFLRRLSLPRP